jgi:hypothetical protein
MDTVPTTPVESEVLELHNPTARGWRNSKAF